MIQQGRLFEGYQVEGRQLSMPTFDVEVEDEYQLVLDRSVVGVFVGVVDVPRFARTKDGGIIRVDKLKGVALRLLDGEQRDALVHLMNLDVPGEGLFFAPPPADHPLGSVDTATGEIGTDESEEEGEDRVEDRVEVSA